MFTQTFSIVSTAPEGRNKGKVEPSSPTPEEEHFLDNAAFSITHRFLLLIVAARARSKRNVSASQQ